MKKRSSKEESTKRICLHCERNLSIRFKIKFCSNRCQIDHQYKKYISTWKQGVVNGSTGIYALTFSRHIRRYLLEKHGSKCALCGWDKKNPILNVVPLEVDHIDGNAENNSEDNLTLLCPNCHSLTAYFKNLNKGKGRKWRKDKYIKNLK